jgi:maleylpyruvate isomerase
MPDAPAITPVAEGTVPWPEEAAREYVARGWWRGRALGTELWSAVGAPARRARATAAIAGFIVLNDVTMRDWQYRTTQWLQGKTFEATTPIGPVLVTPDELPGGVRPALRLTAAVDGETVQKADTSDLVFDPVTLVLYVSVIMTLRPGDVIATGTPGGVGHARKPPRYQAAGMTLTTEIGGIGRLGERRGGAVTARRWMDDGTRLFLGTLADLGDGDLDRATTLPGWTGRHIVAHVHYNARALGRLVQWAATGTENRMYASPEQRAREIEAGAALPAAELRDLVRRSADGLAAALDDLPEDAWQATVVTAQGRTVPATEIPWMRAREVCVHAVDLGAGITFGGLPADFTAALLADVVRKRAGAGEGPGLAARLTGRAPAAPKLAAWL